MSLQTENAQSLSFSPMGEWIYVAHARTNEVTALSHKRLQLEEHERFRIGNADTQILFNRRGTRFYRSGPKGLEIGYTKTNKVIKSIDFRLGPMDWAFSPDFRYLWGLARNNDSLVVVDERKARLVKTVNISHRAGAPVISADGKRVFVIAESGRSVIIINSRSYKVVDEMGFPAPIDGIALDENGLLWAGSAAAQSVYAVDTATGTAKAPIALGEKPRQILYIRLKSGGDYACF